MHRHILEMVLDTVMTEEGRHEFLPRDENGKKDFSNKKICEDSLAKARSYEEDLQRLKSRMDISVTQKRANTESNAYKQTLKLLKGKYLHSNSSINLSEAIKKFEQSDFAKKNKTLLMDSYQNDLDVTQSEFTGIVKYVKLSVAPKHGNMAGILSNVTPRNFHNQKPIKSAIFRTVEEVPETERPAMEAYLSDEKTEYWNDNPTIPNKHFPLKPWDIGYVVEVTEHKTEYRFMGFLFLSDIDNDIFCQYEDLRNRHFANKSWIAKWASGQVGKWVIYPIG